MRLSRKGKYNLLNTNGNSVSNFIIGLQTKILFAVHYFLTQSYNIR